MYDTILALFSQISALTQAVVQSSKRKVLFRVLPMTNQASDASSTLHVSLC